MMTCKQCGGQFHEHWQRCPAEPKRDCPHGRQIGKCADCDVIELEAECERLREQVKALQSDANSWQSGYDKGRSAVWAEFKALRRSADENEKYLREELEGVRAELVAARKQEPVASVVSCYVPSGKRVALNTEYQNLPVGTQLYTLPPASPDVEGLVKALEAADEYLSDNRLNEIGSGSILHRQMQDALSTWRQAQEVKP